MVPPNFRGPLDELVLDGRRSFISLPSRHVGRRGVGLTNMAEKEVVTAILNQISEGRENHLPT